MLVLSREQFESIVIGDNIRITVLDITAQKIRLGIDAPIDVSVNRLEVHEKKREQKAEQWKQ